MACGGDPEELNQPKSAEINLQIKTQDLAGRALGGVRFYIQGRVHGRTDSEGIFKGPLRVEDGDTLSFGVETPEGYNKAADSTGTGTWRRKIRLPKDDRTIQVDFKAILQATRREYLVMVKGSRPGLPIRINGKSRAHTGVNGISLTRTRGNPGQPLRLSLGKRISWDGRFSNHDEVYLLTKHYQGPISKLPLQAEEPKEPRGYAARKVAAQRALRLEALRSDLGPSEEPLTLNREELLSVIEGIRMRWKGALSAIERSFLKGIQSHQAGYCRAHHLIASDLKGRKQDQELKHVLEMIIQESQEQPVPESRLSLAKVLERQGDRVKALIQLQQAESEMQHLSAAWQLKLLRLHADLLETEYRAQKEEAPERANRHLVEQNILRLERIAALKPTDQRAIQERIQALKEE